MTDECRLWLLALLRVQPEYRVHLLTELYRLSGSYRMAMLLLDAVRYQLPVPKGMEAGYLHAQQIVRIGCRLPGSEESLRKFISRKNNVRSLKNPVDKIAVR